MAPHRRYFFYRWRDDGLLAGIKRALVALARLAAGRDMQPTGGVIDSQSMNTSENTSLSGFDAPSRRMPAFACRARGKRINGRKRQMVADGGYAGPKLPDALVGLGRRALQIVKRSDTAKGFAALPRRSVVERTLA